MNDADRPQRKRTVARELALKFLFMHDIRGDEVREELTEFLVQSDADNESKQFAKRIALGCLDTRESLDAKLDEAAENWSLARMATVDRNILRIAAWEMLHGGETPAKVAINEAIEIGKKYGSAKTASFVNGILDRIRRAADEVES